MEASAYLAGDGDGAGITATGLPAVRGIAAVDPEDVYKRQVFMLNSSFH